MMTSPIPGPCVASSNRAESRTLRLTGRLRINYDPHYVADALRQRAWLGE